MCATVDELAAAMMRRFWGSVLLTTTLERKCLGPGEAHCNLDSPDVIGINPPPSACQV